MTADARALLPREVQVLERGWLSSNNVILLGQGHAALVDSGYWTHSAQTLSLVERAIGGRALRTLVNTHLHSDHCGGNAALQARHADLVTLIPPGLAPAVRTWDEVALTYKPTGQVCPRFRYDGLAQPGTDIELAGQRWLVHAAPGHDPHSVVLFQPDERILVSADALWENGFGIVFPELEGEDAFDQVAQTLDLIEGLGARVVIPGHGRVFTDVGGAVARARSRKQAYVSDPRRHASHAAKVLLKFKLLEFQQVSTSAFLQWAEDTPYLRLMHERFHGNTGRRAWLEWLIADLGRSGALRREGDNLHNV